MVNHLSLVTFDKHQIFDIIDSTITVTEKSSLGKCYMTSVQAVDVNPPILKYLPHDLTKRLFINLNVLDGWQLSQTCSRLKNEFEICHTNYPLIVNPVCENCGMKAVESRQKYYDYFEKMVSFFQDFEDVKKAVLPMICNQCNICPCQYNRKYVSEEVFPKMEDGQFIFTLSSKTIFSFEIKSKDGLVIAFRYLSNDRENHSLLYLEQRNDLQIYVQDLDIDALQRPVLLLQTPSTNLKKHIQLILKYMRPFDLNSLNNYSDYMSGNYAEI